MTIQRSDVLSVLREKPMGFILDGGELGEVLLPRYAAMRDEKPELAGGLEKVEPEHEELAELSEALRNDVEAIASGAAVTRDTLVNDATDYIGRLREHMNWEEGDLFKRADSLVADEKAMFLDISHLDGLDPVFGPEREHTFANLLENIRAFSEET